jgi:FixJ family two-component response regulator
MPGAKRPKLIAIIDDDEAMQDSLRDLMEAPGLERSSYVAQINP